MKAVRCRSRCCGAGTHAGCTHERHAQTAASDCCRAQSRGSSAADAGVFRRAHAHLHERFGVEHVRVVLPLVQERGVTQHARRLRVDAVLGHLRGGGAGGAGWWVFGGCLVGMVLMAVLCVQQQQRRRRQQQQERSVQALPCVCAHLHERAARDGRPRGDADAAHEVLLHQVDAPHQQVGVAGAGRGRQRKREREREGERGRGGDRDRGGERERVTVLMAAAEQQQCSGGGQRAASCNQACTGSVHLPRAGLQACACGSVAAQAAAAAGLTARARRPCVR